MTIHEDGTAINVIETEEQLEQRRFTGPRSSDEGNLASRVHREADVTNAHRPCIMGKAHVPKLHMPLRGCEHFGIRAVRHIGLHVEQAMKLFEINRTLFDFTPGKSEDIERRIQAEQDHHDSGQITNLHGALRVVPGRERQHGEVDVPQKA